MKLGSSTPAVIAIVRRDQVPVAHRNDAEQVEPMSPSGWFESSLRSPIVTSVPTRFRATTSSQRSCCILPEVEDTSRTRAENFCGNARNV